MASIIELEPILMATYSRYWNDWFLKHSECKPARLSLTQDSHYAPCYDPKADAITILVAGGSLRIKRNVLTLDSDDAWFIWQGALVHEILHEYESKVLSTPTEAGKALWQSHPPPAIFRDGHHEAMFFTAICDRAPYFRMTPQELRGKMG